MKKRSVIRDYKKSSCETGQLQGRGCPRRGGRYLNAVLDEPKEGSLTPKRRSVRFLGLSVHPLAVALKSQAGRRMGLLWLLLPVTHRQGPKTLGLKG